MKLLILFFGLIPTVIFGAEKNIIFFITDDQSPTLGCYGDPVAATPAVDALAGDGMFFRNAFATTASCSASRSVVMSGLHNHKNGQYGHTHDFHKFESFRNVISFSLPRVLADVGYRTIQIGKYHVAPEEVFHFETYLHANSRNAVEMANECEKEIKAKDDRPFFIYFATSDPHRSAGVDKHFSGKHKPNLFGNLKDKQHHNLVKEVFYKGKEVIVPPFLPDTAESRSELAHYYQSCARIDQGLARLVELLKEAGLYDKTMIVFTADHGMAFPGGKTTVYEGGLRVPFVVRNPYEQKRGIESDAMVSHVDITPSLLDFAGGLDGENNAPKNLLNSKAYWKSKSYVNKDNLGGNHKWKSYHGRSWLPVLGKTGRENRDMIYASHTFHEIQMYYPMRVIQDRSYKFIWNIASALPYPFASDLFAASTWQAQLEKGNDAPYGTKTVGEYVQRAPFELFAIDKDPYEKYNLALDPQYAGVLATYKEKLKAFQIEMHDPWVLKWKYE